jgi:hypothetical protein
MLSFFLNIVLFEFQRGGLRGIPTKRAASVVTKGTVRLSSGEMYSVIQAMIDNKKEPRRGEPTNTKIKKYTVRARKEPLNDFCLLLKKRS